MTRSLTLLLLLAPALGASPEPLEGRPASLAMVSSSLRGRLAARHRAKEPHEAGWFGGFDQMESTYTEEGENAYRELNPARTVQGGFQFGYTSPLKDNEIKDHVWFHESPSAGDLDAWQSHYPEVDGSVAGNRNVRANKWRETAFQGWVQDYNPSYLTGKRAGKPGRYPAEWFDSSVLNYDGFGREMLPYPDTPRRAMQDGDAWTERAVNTTVECADIGCTANSTLTAYDASAEQAQNCRLTIGVHPTDFDDDWGREKIDQWTVNGFLVKAMCDPRARGCNASAARPLYTCVNDLGVDHILDSAGSLSISGTINRLVDECPYNGNLLSAVATVTCLVRPIPPAPTTAAPALQAEAPAQQVARTAMANVTLSCSAPGCNASTVLDLDPAIAMLGGQCLMNISVAQTDFDDDLGLPEQLDFLALEGVGNLTLSQPTQNPCNSEYAGNPLPEDQRTHMVVTDENVTGALLAMPAGSIRLTGKISDQVDECASNGKLLDAVIQVRCTLPEEAAAAVEVVTAAPNATADAAAPVEASANATATA